MQRRRYLQDEEDRRKVRGLMWAFGLVVAVLITVTLLFLWWGA